MGTETSKYHQEKKTNVIPVVVVSELGTAKNLCCVSLCALQHEGCGKLFSKLYRV